MEIAAKQKNYKMKQSWGFEGWQTAGLNALTTEGYVHAAEGLVEAAARELEGLKSFKCLKSGKRMPQRRVFKGLKAGKQQAWMP